MAAVTVTQRLLQGFRQTKAFRAGTSITARRASLLTQQLLYQLKHLEINVAHKMGFSLFPVWGVHRKPSVPPHPTLKGPKFEVLRLGSGRVRQWHVKSHKDVKKIALWDWFFSLAGERSKPAMGNDADMGWKKSQLGYIVWVGNYKTQHWVVVICFI